MLSMLTALLFAHAVAAETPTLEGANGPEAVETTQVQAPASQFHGMQFWSRPLDANDDETASTSEAALGPSQPAPVQEPAPKQETEATAPDLSDAYAPAAAPRAASHVLQPVAPSRSSMLRRAHRAEQLSSSLGVMGGLALAGGTGVALLGAHTIANNSGGLEGIFEAFLGVILVGVGGGLGIFGVGFISGSIVASQTAKRHRRAASQVTLSPSFRDQTPGFVLVGRL